MMKVEEGKKKLIFIAISLVFIQLLIPPLFMFFRKLIANKQDIQEKNLYSLSY